MVTQTFSHLFYHSCGFASLTMKSSKTDNTETIFSALTLLFSPFLLCFVNLPTALILSGPLQYNFTFQVKNNSACRILLLSWNINEDKFQTVHFQGKICNYFRTVECFPYLEGVFINFWWRVILKEAQKLCPLI